MAGYQLQEYEYIPDEAPAEDPTAGWTELQKQAYKYMQDGNVVSQQQVDMVLGTKRKKDAKSKKIIPESEMGTKYGERPDNTYKPWSDAYGDPKQAAQAFYGVWGQLNDKEKAAIYNQRYKDSEAAGTTTYQKQSKNYKKKKSQSRPLSQLEEKLIYQILLQQASLS